MAAGEKINLPGLQTEWLGKTVYRYSSVLSTQDTLKELARSGALNGTVVLADRQTEGRGRQGRTWIDIPGEQIFASFYMALDLPIERFPIVNIAAGLAVCDAIESLGVPTPKIKWPNDVFLGGKKVCGILSELHGAETARAVILGIGLNVNGEAGRIPEDIRPIATTLECWINRLDRWTILSRLCTHIEKWIVRLTSRGPKSIQESFAERWVWKGQSIQVIQGDQTLIGRADSIDDYGALLLQTNRGTERVVSGDVSLSA